ncbi:MAG: CHAT domain-containing protein [Cyanobacteria bacterium]|nr:CHAT domain-containing protein [Cyanobacteriota bacterium]
MAFAIVIFVVATPAVGASIDEYWRLRDALREARASGTLRHTAKQLRDRDDVRATPALRLFVSGYAALLDYDRPAAARDLAASFAMAPSAATAAALAEQASEIGDPEPVLDWTARGFAAPDRDVRAEVELHTMRAQGLSWVIRRDEGRAEAAAAVERARSAGDPRLLGLALRAYAYAIEDERTQALATFEEAIRVSDAGGDAVAVGYHLLIMSGPYYPAHPLADKVPLLDRALSLARESRDRQLEGRVLGARGLVWYELARYSAALRDLTSADAILRTTGAVRSRAVAAGNLGLLFTDLGDYHRAEQQIRLSIALYRNVGNRHGVRNCLDDLSRLALLQGRAGVALSSYARVVALTRALGDAEYLSGALVRLSLAHQATREWAAAERTVREALALPIGMSQPDVRGEARVALGHVLRATGRTPEAKRVYQEALDIAAGAATEATLTVRAHHGLALLASAAGRSEDALVHFRAAAIGTERIRSDVEQASWRLTYFANTSALYTDAIESLVAAYQRTGDATFAREALTFAERAKARVLLEAIGEAGDRSRPAAVEEIAAALDPGDLLVEFVTGEERSYAFTLTRDGRIGVHQLPSRATLEQRVRALRDQVSQRPSTAADVASVQRAGARAYAALLGPLLADGDPAAVRRLVIVADGILWYAPFEAFTIANTNVYLADRFEVVRAASGSVLTTIRRRGARVSADAPFVGFGDPSLPATGRSDSAMARMLERDGFSLAPLPGSRREVEAAAAAFGTRARSYVGPAFTADTVIEALQRPNLAVHFATHAILDERVPTRSGIVVSAGAGGSAPALLRARDIAAIRIPAELVVLSACQTGLGRVVAGEGVLGLAWAFSRAGAASLVVTLWNISDASSATMMATFYRELAAGAAKSAALTAARREMLGGNNPALRHPYYWAGYVLIGDPH